VVPGPAHPTGTSHRAAAGGRHLWELPGGVAVLSTCTADGDLSDRTLGYEARRRAVVDRAWSIPRQVHGAEVTVVDRPGAGCDDEVDALVTRRGDVTIAVLTADCAPVAFASPEGVVGIAHAGWRGLEAGVIQVTVGAMRDLGATTVSAVLGPCIHAECNEFGAADLDLVAARYGPVVRARDGRGGDALDLPAGVRAAVAESGATLVSDAGTCTACSPSHWSWRDRGDTARQATVVWCR
jgi:copper oxidase (laccase) domain-containing protein